MARPADEVGPRPLEKRLREAKKNAARRAERTGSQRAQDRALTAENPPPARAEKKARSRKSCRPAEPDMGDLIVVLLASTLAGLRDRLADDGYDGAAELVAEMVEMADDYLARTPGRG